MFDKTLRETAELSQNTAAGLRDALLDDLDGQPLPEPWAVSERDKIEETVDGSGDWTIAAFEAQNSTGELALVYVTDSGDCAQLFFDGSGTYSRPVYSTSGIVRELAHYPVDT